MKNTAKVRAETFKNVPGIFGLAFSNRFGARVIEFRYQLELF